MGLFILLAFLFAAFLSFTFLEEPYAATEEFNSYNFLLASEFNSRPLYFRELFIYLLRCVKMKHTHQMAKQTDRRTRKYK